MMNLTALGINHNSASLDLREKVAFAPEQMVEALRAVCELSGIREAVILSTCNRTELYVSGENADATVGTSLLDWLADYHRLRHEEVQRCAYQHEGDAALAHLMQVASGLDSMVLGEPQIFGQMKSAFALATEAGTVGSEFGRVFPKVFSIAKRVRTDTAIGENPVSVAYAAVDLASHIFTDLRRSRALLVGAGETIELVARHLREAGVQRLVIANRTLTRAAELAQQFGAEAVMLSDIPEQLEFSDIVITSTASQLPILGKGAVEAALRRRKHRPILMVDIAVPRDIEPQVGELRDVYLYTIDDLRQIVEKNLRSRHDEARKADVIIAEGIREFAIEIRTLAAVDTVKEYRQLAETIRDQELERARRLLGRGEDPEQVLVMLARGLTNKLIHSPTSGLKQATAAGRTDLLHAVRPLLGLATVDTGSAGQEAEDVTLRSAAAREAGAE